MYSVNRTGETTEDFLLRSWLNWSAHSLTTCSLCQEGQHPQNQMWIDIKHLQLLEHKMWLYSIEGTVEIHKDQSSLVSWFIQVHLNIVQQG